MRLFMKKQVREAIAYAAEGGQALHVHDVIADKRKAPIVFRQAVARGEYIAHLFDQDASRLRDTVRRLGVNVVKIERRGTDRQHVDLCSGPLRLAIHECHSRGD